MESVSRVAIALALVGCQAAIGLRAQAPQTFSGKWTPIAGAQTEWVRLGPALTIEHTATTFTVGSGATKKSFRIGAETTHQEKTEGEVRTITTRLAWAGQKLILTETWSLKKRETTYSIDDQGRLTVTGSTSLMHTRGGALTVDTVGPITRVYQKAKDVWPNSN